MKVWNPSVFAHWFVVARADRVKHKPIAVTVFDRPLVLVRLTSGEVISLEDRCPHRQVPLSHGRLTDKGLECPYHGWTFGRNGRCTSVPGLPPDTCLPGVGARAYAVKELDGLIWVRLATIGDTAPPNLISDLLIGSRRFLWQTSWKSNVIDALENFLDPLHTHLIHPGLVRKDNQRARMQATLCETGEGFTVDYTGQAEQSGILYCLFESPRTSERVYFVRAGTAQIEYRYQNGSVVRITLHFTPETSKQTHVFATMHVENRWAPSWVLRLMVWPFLKRVGQQDARILALQSENLVRFPDVHYASTNLDLVRPYLEKVWRPDQSTHSLPETNRIELFL